MLTDTEKQILRLATAPYKYQGAREADIMARFGNVTHFYQQLNRILDTEAAYAHDPHTVGSLRARRRRRVRS